MSPTEPKDGGPAFPIPAEPGFPTDVGMSLRDWFAGQALAGMYSCGERMLLAMAADGKSKEEKDSEATFARVAYVMADAMLKARQQP